MVELAVAHVVHWEQSYGWTRGGEGWVSEREASLASTLAGFLVVPDLWTTAAHRYAELLDPAEHADLLDRLPGMSR